MVASNSEQVVAIENLRFIGLDLPVVYKCSVHASEVCNTPSDLCPVFSSALPQPQMASGDVDAVAVFIVGWSVSANSIVRPR